MDKSFDMYFQRAYLLVIQIFFHSAKKNTFLIVTSKEIDGYIYSKPISFIGRVNSDRVGYIAVITQPKLSVTEKHGGLFYILATCSS